MQGHVSLLFLPPLHCLYPLKVPTNIHVCSIQSSSILSLCLQFRLMHVLSFTVAAPAHIAGVQQECIGIGLWFTHSMHHAEIIGLELFNSACHLALWFFKGYELLECSVLTVKIGHKGSI